MADQKAEISQVENSPIEHHHHHHRTLEDLAANEDEPQTPYQLGWRTIVCVLTLSMGNVCAALSNTVSLSTINIPGIETAGLSCVSRQTLPSNSKWLRWRKAQLMHRSHLGLQMAISLWFLRWVLSL